MKHSSTPTRRKFTASERADWVARYRQSGLTQSAFARQRGLPLGTLHQWLHRFKDYPSPPQPPIFKELILPASAPAWSAEISLGQDCIVRLGASASPEFVVQVVNRLRRPC